MSSESAFETIRLPTVPEIEAATERLSMSDAYDQVFRVGERFAGETMKFLEEHQVPVPQVHAAFEDPNSKKTYIIMDHVPGDTLESLLPSLNPSEKATICKLIKDAMSKLRNNNPKISGPFTNQEDLNLAIIERMSQIEKEQYIRLLRPMIDQTLRGHRPVFTHGDLQPKNIMVERLGVRDGCPEFNITLLVREGAGWFPEYWEFCNATIACRFKPDWLELVPDILEQYSLEFLMMQVVYASVFY
ncbi:aminoglycoside phosphotransferase family protein [Aspergillus niger CBS 101883]|uniref:aminoglycoside phosphotransferase family protein n=1 Tax=Aspergillus lacticoffeatus (strain CBS 101883) TaxID=1450533 RepID=UPI000D803F20|nr:phosphotransferase enzyme family protein [Aspergillus niger CBS 101883]PYH51875.1 phosphotransferase enzyme family protein [Aspergillus niger CBS 101883]